MTCKATHYKYPLEILLLSDASMQRDVGLRVFLFSLTDGYCVQTSYTLSSRAHVRWTVM